MFVPCKNPRQMLTFLPIQFQNDVFCNFEHGLCGVCFDKIGGYMQMTSLVIF